MAESIKNSINKLGQTIKSSNFQKTKSPVLLPFGTKSKPELETLINTPINSIISTKPSLYEKTQDFTSKTIQNTSSIFSFRNILFTIILIFLLSFLGFNVFTQLSDGTNFLTKIFRPIVSATGNVTGNATNNIISNTSTGTQKIIETTSDTTKNIVDVAGVGSTSSIGFLQDRLKKSTSIVNPENDNILTDNVNNKINTNNSQVDSEPEPVKTQALKQGYCFIGKINNTRNCAKVNERQQCMSGDIYPSMDICINPNIRMQ